MPRLPVFTATATMEDRYVSIHSDRGIVYHFVNTKGDQFIIYRSHSHYIRETGELIHDLAEVTEWPSEVPYGNFDELYYNLQEQRPAVSLGLESYVHDTIAREYFSRLIDSNKVSEYEYYVPISDEYIHASYIGFKVLRSYGSDGSPVSLIVDYGGEQPTHPHAFLLASHLYVTTVLKAGSLIAMETNH